MTETIKIILNCLNCKKQEYIFIKQQFKLHIDYQLGKVICKQCKKNEWSIELEMKGNDLERLATEVNIT
jgi:hypothetical protein